MLTVWVPYDAKVTVNGLETRSTGSRRQFVSFGLKPGLSYKYVVRAQVVRNGQSRWKTQTVMLTAGQITAVAFGFNTEGDSKSHGPVSNCPVPGTDRERRLPKKRGPRNGIWPVRGVFSSFVAPLPICG